MNKSIVVCVASLLLLLQSLSFFGCHKEGEKYAQALVKTLDSGKIMRTKKAMDIVAYSLNRYMIDSGQYPDGEDFSSIGSVLVPGYLNELDTVDGWDNTLYYSSDGQHFTLISSGEDSVLNTSDDIVMIDGVYQER